MGFGGRIIGSKETITFSKTLLKDSVYIHSKNIEYLNSKGKKVKPLYTEKQLYQTFNHMEAVPVGEKIHIDGNMYIVLNKNNHVVGATSISVFIKKKNNRWYHILYSSDMGTNITADLQPFLWDNELPKKCDYFLCEATYNNKDRQITRKQAIEERESLKQYIKKCINENKRILFATFSFSRSQYLLYLFYTWFKDEEWFQKTPLIVDGLLVNNINNNYLSLLEGEDKELFNNIMNMRNLKLNKTYDSTLATLSKREPMIVLAGSGFCSAGRVVTYLPPFLGSSKDVCILTGFSGAEGSTGWKILNPLQKTVTIDGKTILKRSEILQLKTLTSHVTHNELLDLFVEMRCEKIIIHHSDEEGKKLFVEEAKGYLKSKNKTTPIVAVSKSANQFVL
jgi:metallo-beta-lactamase family protein